MSVIQFHPPSDFSSGFVFSDHKKLKILNFSAISTAFSTFVRVFPICDHCAAEQVLTCGNSITAIKWNDGSCFVFPAVCEFRSMIIFLNAQMIVPTEIHRELYDVYGRNVLNVQMAFCSLTSLSRTETVTAKRYCETQRKLRRTIQNKRCGMLSAGVVLIHDNALPHTARQTTNVL